jgi:hypothetical protein
VAPATPWGCNFLQNGDATFSKNACNFFQKKLARNTLFILVPFGGGFRRLMLSGNGLYHHTLCPVLSVISYVLWEGHSAVWQVPVAITFVYGIVMMYLNYRECFDGPYPFFRVNHQSRLATALWMAGLTGMITVIALVIRMASGTA